MSPGSRRPPVLKLCVALRGPTLPHFKQPTQHLWHMMPLIGAAMSELRKNDYLCLQCTQSCGAILFLGCVRGAGNASELINAGTHTCMGTNSPWSLPCHFSQIPLRLNHRAHCLEWFNFCLQFSLGQDNVVSVIAPIRHKHNNAAAPICRGCFLSGQLPCLWLGYVWWHPQQVALFLARATAGHSAAWYRYIHAYGWHPLTYQTSKQELGAHVAYRNMIPPFNNGLIWGYFLV